MITEVQLKYFKHFKNQSFSLKDIVILAGPNNSGKTTFLQAIATWHFALREWKNKKKISSSKKNSGVPLTRKEFLSVPMQRFNLLWTDASATLRKDEGGGGGAATPRIMQITVKGIEENGGLWEHSMEFRYANSELIYTKPIGSSATFNEQVNVVYVPSFSGIEAEEKIHTREFQEWLIGQGKPGDIIRNLLVETHSNKDAWDSLREDIETLFGYRLLDPQSTGRAFILCEYLPGIPGKRGHGGFPALDIASAGSGFLQTLLLLSFFYARPSTVLLIDEPDAHMHVILQKQVYDHLRKIAMEKNCQVVVATHSEVIIDNTPPEKIISFFGEPGLLIKKDQRNQVREALKRLNSMDILLSKRGRILYLEDHSDFNILQAWASTLNHDLKTWFSDPFYFPIKGNEPKRAEDHFFALRAVNKGISGVLLLDGDGKSRSDRDAQDGRLKIIHWKRYEIESYLIHPESIKRFLDKRSLPLLSELGEAEMNNKLPPAIAQSPFEDDPYLLNVKVSEGILPQIFSAAEIDITKQDYYRLAEEMYQDEIHPDVIECLDTIQSHLEQDTTGEN